MKSLVVGVACLAALVATAQAAEPDEVPVVLKDAKPGSVHVRLDYRFHGGATIASADCRAAKKDGKLRLISYQFRTITD